MCDQQRLRPAYAYAQSDQSLCLSLEYYMNIKLLNEHHLEFVSLKGGCTGSSESIHVKTPHCWKSHDTAHISSLCELNSKFAFIIFQQTTAGPVAYQELAYVFEDGVLTGSNGVNSTSMDVQGRLSTMKYNKK